jgi:hypothetical protein|tara:strand:- start:128 stop:523 length:396 start_codon:yes stop_codon:yes gene_type:complete
MINTNLSQFFRSFFYLFTGFLVLDFGYMLLKPIIKGYHVLYFLEFSIANNSLSWIFALLCIAVAILMKDRSKSLWQTIISKEHRTVSLTAVGLFTFLTLAIVSVIYLPDIIYDYTHDQCLSQWWYCFDFLK